MNGFLGTYSISIDDKGRFTVPSKFRNILETEYGPQLVISEMDGYLVVFPQQEWSIIKEKWGDFNELSSESRREKRKVFARAGECEMKSGGKILIQSNLRELAGLKKEALLIGMTKSFEIWSPENYAKEME